MKTYRMIVKTQSVDLNGRPTSTTDTISHIPADQLPSRRDAAKMSAPAGATRTIKVVDQILG